MNETEYHCNNQILVEDIPNYYYKIMCSAQKRMVDGLQSQSLGTSHYTGTGNLQQDHRHIWTGPRLVSVYNLTGPKIILEYSDTGSWIILVFNSLSHCGNTGS